MLPSIRFFSLKSPKQFGLLLPGLKARLHHSPSDMLLPQGHLERWQEARKESFKMSWCLAIDGNGG